MKLRNETSWKGPHVHHRDPHAKPRMLWWPQRSDKCRDTLNGTSCYPAALLAVFDEAARRSPLISIDNETLEGQPCISGTRIPVRSVLRALELCGSIEEVRVYYPDIDIQQVKDALYFSQVVLEPPRGIDETEAAY